MYRTRGIHTHPGGHGTLVDGRGSCCLSSLLLSSSVFNGISIAKTAAIQASRRQQSTRFHKKQKKVPALSSRCRCGCSAPSVARCDDHFAMPIQLFLALPLHYCCLRTNKMPSDRRVGFPKKRAFHRVFQERGIRIRRLNITCISSTSRVGSPRKNPTDAPTLKKATCLERFPIAATTSTIRTTTTAPSRVSRVQRSTINDPLIRAWYGMASIEIPPQIIKQNRVVLILYDVFTSIKAEVGEKSTQSIRTCHKNSKTEASTKTGKTAATPPPSRARMYCHPRNTCSQLKGEEFSRRKKRTRIGGGGGGS